MLGRLALSPPTLQASVTTKVSLPLGMVAKSTDVSSASSPGGSAQLLSLAPTPLPIPRVVPVG